MGTNSMCSQPSVTGRLPKALSSAAFRPTSAAMSIFSATVRPWIFTPNTRLPASVNSGSQSLRVAPAMPLEAGNQ